MDSTPSLDHKQREWGRHFDRWRRSGLSQRLYCEKHGLALSTFQLWRRRLARRPAEPSEGVTTKLEFIPVPLLRRSEAPPVALLVGNGRYRLEFGDHVCKETLRAVLEVLEERK